MVISKLVSTTWDGLVYRHTVPGDAFAAKAANEDDLRLKTSRETGAGPNLVWGSIRFRHLLPL